MKLRYSKSLQSNLTEEQDEYNYVKSINISLNITSKKEYSDSYNIHTNYINSPEEYFKLKGVWINWYDFMGTNTSKFIQTKSEWCKICRNLNIYSLEEYYTNCEKYDYLPKEPGEFYKKFTNILLELNSSTNRR
jgi:hypothetical protein